MKDWLKNSYKEWKEAMIELNDYSLAFFILFGLMLVCCMVVQLFFIGRRVPIWGYEYKSWMYVCDVVQAALGYLGVFILWQRDNKTGLFKKRK